MHARREEEDTSGMDMRIGAGYYPSHSKPRSIADKICEFLENRLR